MLSVLEVRQAELEKVNLEVETEVLYLNTTGLRKLAVWTGVREARVSGRGRVEVLRDVRSYVTRHMDGEDNIEGKIAFLTRMRDQIRDLMQEPDNWEQTPSHHRVMVTSPVTSEPSARRRSPVREGQPIPVPRRNMFAEFSTPAPQSRASGSSLASDGRRRVLPQVPDLSAVGQQSPLVSVSQHSPLESVRNRASSHASSARSLPVTPGFSFNSIPPWNRGGQQVGDNASLLASLARVEGDRQRDAAQANDSDNTQQLLSESGTEDGDQQGTFTIDGSEAEDNLRIQELQNEIEKLQLQRKRKNLSSKSTSSSGSSAQRSVKAKVPRRQNSGSSSNGSKSSRQLKSSPHKDAPVSRRKALSGSSDEDRAAAVPHGRKSSSRNDRRRKALSGSSDESHDARARRKSSRSDRPRSSIRRTIRRVSSSGSSMSSEGSSSSPGSPVSPSKKMSRSVSARKLKVSPRRKVGVSYPRSPLSDKRGKSGRQSPSHRRSRRRKSVSFPDDGSAVKSRGTSISGCTVGDLKDAWRREFKIKGQIGKIGDKENKLDFLSVKRQIENGIKKGHKEPEIIEAVVNCTTAGTTLRSFLQSSTDLTVEILLDILRSYFQEADTVELLQQLSTARQDPKEDPQTFLITLLDLKNRIVRNEDQDIGFSPETVMKIMLKTLESGLADDGILNSMRPFLSDPGVSDNVLIREMSRAVVLAKKRKEKSKAAARVSVIEESPEIAQLQNQLNELQKQQATGGDSAQIAKLQATLNQLVNNQEKGKKPIYGCKQCKADGKGKTCSHCFVCGEEGHKVESCPQKKKKKEEEDTSNSNRSPARD